MEITPIPVSGPGPDAPVPSSGVLTEPVAVRPRVAAGPFELPPSRWLLSGPTMAALALLAGIGSLAFGTLAFVTSVRGGDEATVRDPGIVGFLARPTTRRIPLDLPAGRIVLAVGSGRAYLVLGALPPVGPGRSYRAWISRARGSSRLAASFAGLERVVPLSAKVTPGSVLSITLGRAAAVGGPPSKQRVLARATV